MTDTAALATASTAQRPPASQDNRRRRRVRGIVVTGLAAVVGVLIVIPAAAVTDDFLFSCSTIFMWVILASNFNLVSGFTGYVDFGHAAHFGIGGYVTGILMSRHEWTFWETVPVAMLVAGGFALLIGWPLLRLRGIYFSIAVFGAFLSLQQLSYLLPDLTGGAQGLIIPGMIDRRWFYYVFLAGAVLVLLFSWWLRRSQIGGSLLAIRDDEEGASGRGINTTALKLFAYVLAAMLTSAVGALWAFQATFIDPEIMFREDFLITLGVMATLGGLGYWWGPALGTVVYLLLQDQLWSSTSGGGFLMFFGAALMLLVLFMPEGIAGVVFRAERTAVGRIVLRARRRWFHFNDPTSRSHAESGAQQ
ncbi:branched-chain amino acid ABC transporter permease [Kribbella lupini]|uniref:Branched-chain amino acid ABC transporter permease n=1 Tax=Kribbella lupini TaxID=291602 RepID=A0ABP4ND83_9ACTN